MVQEDGQSKLYQMLQFYFFRVIFLGTLGSWFHFEIYLRDFLRIIPI